MATDVRNLAIHLALWILFLVGVMGPPSAFSQTDTKPAAISVLVLDYSDADPSVLAGAERETSRIFGQAGVRFQWTDCATRLSENSRPACEGEPLRGEIRLRILPRRLSHNFKGSVFGFAIAPTLASVYYESAERLAQTVSDSKSNTSVILGCVMAHEIGHLLLGNDQHTVSGIMQASWDIQQIQRVLRGSLGFSHRQAERMRQSVAVRMEATR